MTRTISILGCGWLGYPLARKLLTKGFRVNGSTTTPDKIPALEKAGIFPFIVQLGNTLIGERLEDFLNVEILVLSVPFKRTLVNPGEYLRQMSLVVEAISKSSIKFLVFTSSTSVYPSGLQEAREEIAFVPDNHRSEILLATEKKLQNIPEVSTTIVRLAGLYGEDRLIGNFLAGKLLPGDGSNPVNLVHQDDCVDIISTLIEQNICGEVFNICSDKHPTQKELYTRAAQVLGLPAPRFQGGRSTSIKKVSNEKIKMRLGYQFQHPDPMEDIV